MAVRESHLASSNSIASILRYPAGNRDGVVLLERVHDLAVIALQVKINVDVRIDQSILVTTPVSVTGFALSYSAPKE